MHARDSISMKSRSSWVWRCNAANAKAARVTWLRSAASAARPARSLTSAGRIPTPRKTHGLQLRCPCKSRQPDCGHAGKSRAGRCRKLVDIPELGAWARKMRRLPRPPARQVGGSAVRFTIAAKHAANPPRAPCLPIFHERRPLHLRSRQRAASPSAYGSKPRLGDCGRGCCAPCGAFVGAAKRAADASGRGGRAGGGDGAVDRATASSIAAAGATRTAHTT